MTQTRILTLFTKGYTNEGSSTDENEWKKSVSNNGSEEYVYREGFYIETKQVSTMTEEIVHISNENAEYYKGLYQDCKRQLTALETTVKAKYTSIVQKYRDLEDNYNAMSLTSTNATEVKDYLIISLNKTVEEYSEKFSVLITEHESKVHEYEEMLSARNKILSSEKEIIDAQSTSEKRLNNIVKGELDFRMKPSKKKASGKNINLSLYNCEGCTATFVDLIKCNLCSEYVCESCNVVTVSKLKMAVQNCKTVYVICKKCEEANTGSTTNEDHVTGSVPDYNQNNQSSLEQLIISKLQKIEYAIDQTITKKLAENYKSIEEKISKANESYAESIKKSLPPSQGNHGQSFREIIREHQNEELVQQKE